MILQFNDHKIPNDQSRWKKNENFSRHFRSSFFNAKLPCRSKNSTKVNEKWFEKNLIWKLFQLKFLFQLERHMMEIQIRSLDDTRLLSETPIHTSYQSCLHKILSFPPFFCASNRARHKKVVWNCRFNFH